MVFVVNVALAKLIVAIRQLSLLFPLGVGRYTGLLELFHCKQLPAENDAAKSADGDQKVKVETIKARSVDTQSGQLLV